MNKILLTSLIVSGLVSLILIVRFWRRDEHILIKTVLSVITLPPFVGPVFHFLYLSISDLEPQSKLLKNNMARGTYTNRWILIRPILKGIAKDRKSKDQNKKEEGGK